MTMPKFTAELSLFPTVGRIPLVPGHVRARLERLCHNLWITRSLTSFGTL